MSVAYLDATSAISLSFPSMEITTSGADLHICCLKESARRRCPALSDRAVNFLVQCTVDVLSHWIPICVFDMDGMRCSSASHSSRTPAISKSLIDSSRVSICALMSLGKAQVQYMYRTSLPCGMIHTPPAPCLHASE